MIYNEDEVLGKIKAHEKQIFEQDTDPIPNNFSQYVEDCFCAPSCSGIELERFINFGNDFHSALQFPCYPS